MFDWYVGTIGHNILRLNPVNNGMNFKILISNQFLVTISNGFHEIIMKRL